MSEDFSFIPDNLAIEAMRDSGYKNTAYALAELIDNSVEAKAQNIEVFIFVGEINNRKKIDKIAVLDDGEGMTSDTLRRALQFGNGTKLDSRKGIGRFGMGLPNSSVSQSLRTEVYTWKNGSTNAEVSFLDVEKIKKGYATVPEPQHTLIPDEYRNISNSISKSGTLIVWAKLDDRRVTWKKSETLISHSEQILGRVYRNFIFENKIQIVFHTVANNGQEAKEVTVKPIDPLYLMEGTSTPDPFDREPMFQLYGEPRELEIDLWDGKKHKVILKFSYAKEKTIELARNDGIHNRGDTKYGKHAKHNCGLSIIRAGRELLLDHRWCTQDSPLNRWWGASIEFEPDLDEFFGVSNNKQYANALDTMIKFNLDSRP